MHPTRGGLDHASGQAPRPLASYQQPAMLCPKQVYQVLLDGTCSYTHFNRLIKKHSTFAKTTVTNEDLQVMRRLEVVSASTSSLLIVSVSLHLECHAGMQSRCYQSESHGSHQGDVHQHAMPTHTCSCHESPWSPTYPHQQQFRSRALCLRTCPLTKYLAMSRGAMACWPPSQSLHKSTHCSCT